MKPWEAGGRQCDLVGTGGDRWESVGIGGTVETERGGPALTRLGGPALKRPKPGDRGSQVTVRNKAQYVQDAF